MAKRTARSTKPSIALRRFIKSKKSWEISLEGSTCKTRDGKAAPKSKTHPSFEQALDAYVLQVWSKLWEGYVEEVKPGRPSPTLPVPAQDVADLATQRARLRSLLETADLSKHAAAILACAKPGVALRLRRMDESDLAVGVSRFGGRPDLPPGTPWPTRVEKKTRDNPERLRPLDFVAQFRLEEIAPLDEAGLLPKSGLLSFFVLGDYDADSSTEPDYLSVCKVIHTAAGKKLERTSPPASLERTWNGERITDPYLAHAVEAFPILTLPPADNRPFEKRLTPAERDRWFEAVDQPFEAWRRTLFPGARGTHLLGYRSRDTDREPQEILFFQCETDLSTQMRWGDADFLYYWITPKALAKADFDAVTSNYAD
jgi:hypothetical protein